MTFLPTAKMKFSVLIVTLALLPLAQAQRWDKKTNLSVSETIEVPGATLTPGEYVVKLVDSQSNRHIVQFLNDDETEVLTTVLAIPNQRLEPTGDTTFSFYETPVGDPPALRAWFYPGDTFGQEFAYPKDRAQQLAQATSQEVPAVPDDVDMTTIEQETRETESTASTQRTTPAPVEREPAEPQRERESDPTTLAQAEPAPAPPQQQQPAPDQEPTAEETPEQLPSTASPAPLFGLIGLASFAAALGLRRLRRR